MSIKPVTLTIAGYLPYSINKLMRTHWALRLKHKTDFLLRLKATATREDVKLLKAWSHLEHKVRIEMEVVTPQLFDEDNLSSLGKIPLDSMVELQWLSGDSPDCVEFAKPTQKKGKKSITFSIIPVVES
jgi:hypothetical protein